MNIRNWLISIYPLAWRERYGEEFEMLLEECVHSPLDVLDIMLGALDAHLEFPYGMSWRTLNMINKLRTSVLLVFVGCIGFVLGGLSLYGLADDSPMASLMKAGSNLPLSATWLAVEVGSAVSLLAVVIGGAPLAFTLIRRALGASHKNLGLLLVPVAALIGLALYAAFAALIAFDRIHIPGVLPVVSPDNFPVGNRLLIGGFMLVFVLGAILSTTAVWRAASNTEDEPLNLGLPGSAANIKPFHFALIPAMITALGMLWMLLATSAWGWLSYSALPRAFSENWGLLLSNTALSFAITLLIMLGSTVVAFIGVARGFSARKPA